MTLHASPGTSRIWLTPVSLIRVAALLAVSAISPAPMQAQQSVLVPAGALWKYLDTGADQGTAWRTPAFNDSGWKTGAAELGYGDGDEATLVAYGPNSTAKFTTTYFRRAFTVADPSAYGGLTLRVLRDDGAIVYLNGTEVFRTNMPTGAVTAATFASSVVFDANERTYVTAAVNPARLVAGTNVLAVEIHQSDATSSDISFNLELTSASAVSVTRGPYLQLGTPSSTVVRWRTSAPVIGRVQYGQSAGAHTWAAQESTATTEHAVTLTGLLPNTTYYYTVGTDTAVLAGGDATHFFLTPPVAGTAKATRVWVLGDSGTANANARAVRDAYYAFTGTRHTNLWLMLGDNAYTNGTDAEYQAAVFDVFPAMLRKSVLWSTLGNHDGFSADSASQTGPYYKIFTLPKAGEAGGLASGTEAYYSFDYANIHFISLESFETNRSATGPMLTWLRNDLASTNQPWIIAFFHHPPYSKGSHDSDVDIELREMRQNALPILEDAGVDLVLSGHSHSVRTLVPDRRALRHVRDVHGRAEEERRQRACRRDGGVPEAQFRDGGPRGRRLRGGRQLRAGERRSAESPRDVPVAQQPRLARPRREREPAGCGVPQRGRCPARLLHHPEGHRRCDSAVGADQPPHDGAHRQPDRPCVDGHGER